MPPKVAVAVVVVVVQRMKKREVTDILGVQKKNLNVVEEIPENQSRKD